MFGTQERTKEQSENINASATVQYTWRMQENNERILHTDSTLERPRSRAFRTETFQSPAAHASKSKRDLDDWLRFSVSDNYQLPGRRHGSSGGSSYGRSGRPLPLTKT